MSRFSVVSFDGDQTLWDLRSTMEAALAKVSGRFAIEEMQIDGQPVTGDILQDIRDDVAASVKYSASSMEDIRMRAFEVAVERCGVRNSRFVRSIYDEYMALRFNLLQLYPETLNVLQELSAEGFRLALVTNGNTQPQAVGLDGVFDAVVLAHTCGYRKPSPLIYAYAAGQLSTPASDWLHVGDDFEEDVRAAQAAGMSAAWLQRDARPLVDGIKVARSLVDVRLSLDSQEEDDVHRVRAPQGESAAGVD